MPESLWKYAENQFLTVTEENAALMGEIIADHLPRLTAAAADDANFDVILLPTASLAGEWNSAETAVANAEAAQKSATLGFTEKLDGIPLKPNADTNSPLETWDATIRSQVPYQGTVYTYLLPLGREPFTSGSYDSRLDALQAFATRLAEQTAKPILVTLGGTVLTYFNQAKALRDAQSTRKAAVTTTRQALENLRLELAQRLHSNVGYALFSWYVTPARIETLWDLTLIRQPTQTLPAAPADTLWLPATRTLTTTALPPGATRLVAWRLAPGGAPEQLATGDFAAPEVTIPITITFLPGTEYQLWLQSRNARGQSDPGPVTLWTAP